MVLPYATLTRRTESALGPMVGRVATRRQLGGEV
jgi:hypothetical protein